MLYLKNVFKNMFSGKIVLYAEHFSIFFVSAGDSLVTVESTLFKFAERVRNLVVQRLDSEAETDGAPGKLTTN